MKQKTTAPVPSSYNYYSIIKNPAKLWCVMTPRQTRNRLLETLSSPRWTMWMTSHPMLGLCKTPTILWIRSMATLCWKLLKPVNQKQIHPVRHRCCEPDNKGARIQTFTASLSYTWRRARSPLSLVISVNVRVLMSQLQDCRFTHAALWTTSIGCCTGEQALCGGRS